MKEFRTEKKNFHSWWWNYLDPAYQRIQISYYTFVAKMRLTYQTNRYPFSEMLDEEELFFMSAADRDAKKVA